MSGVLVLGELLRTYAPLIERVPADLISEAQLTEGSGRGIAIESISVAAWVPLSDTNKRHVRERVQVTVWERNVRDRRTTWNLVRNAGAGRRGDFAGVTEVSVVLDSAGPDQRLTNPEMYLKTQDFFVSYNETVPPE